MPTKDPYAENVEDMEYYCIEAARTAPVANTPLDRVVVEAAQVEVNRRYPEPGTTELPEGTRPYYVHLRLFGRLATEPDGPLRRMIMSTGTRREDMGKVTLVDIDAPDAATSWAAVVATVDPLIAWQFVQRLPVVASKVDVEQVEVTPEIQADALADAGWAARVLLDSRGRLNKAVAETLAAEEEAIEREKKRGGGAQNWH